VAQKSTKRHKTAQKSTNRPKVAQKSTNRHILAQTGTKEHKVAHFGTKRHKTAQKSTKEHKVAQSGTFWPKVAHFGPKCYTFQTSLSKVSRKAAKGAKVAESRKSCRKSQTFFGEKSPNLRQRQWSFGKVKARCERLTSPNERFRKFMEKYHSSHGSLKLYPLSEPFGFA
jgi:hypothetical protein